MLTPQEEEKLKDIWNNYDDNGYHGTELAEILSFLSRIADNHYKQGLKDAVEVIEKTTKNYKCGKCENDKIYEHSLACKLSSDSIQAIKKIK